MNIRETIESLFGSKASIISSHMVSGGDINEAAVLELSGGEKVFLKTNRDNREAMPYFDNSMRRKIDKMLEHLDRYLVEPERASLLHGDLWGGNFITGSDGCAWLIDPAVYVGCAEADIAMTELFGGFSGEFYKTYNKVGLLMDGYEDRRDIYNLYHLLNHLISFGRSYYGSVARIVEYYAG